jgi:TonB family protein
MAVVAAFYGLPHGGLEIGGILLGSYSADRITITGSQPLQCEHAFGPTFRLTASDHGRLSAAIEGAQAAGQTVVGWFLSHTRTGICLSEADLEIHNRHFKEPWQVALVLKPATWKPTMCGFFFREADGSIHSTESYEEFELEGQPPEDRHARVSSPELDWQDLSVAAVPESRRRPREDEEHSQAPQESIAVLPPMDESQARREHAIVSPNGDGLPQWEIAGRAAQERKSAGRHFHWVLMLAGAVIVLALGVTYAFLSRSAPEVQATGQQTASNRAFGFRIESRGAELVLRWDPNATDLLGATAGLLSIKDGSTQKEVGLNLEQLRSGTYLVTPESDHMEIQLTMLLPNHRTASEAGIVSLPARTLIDPVAPGKTVPSKNLTEARFSLESPEDKAGRAFVAPPQRTHAPNVPSLDQPPALNGIEPAERSQPIPLASLGTFRSFPPAPAVPAAQTSPGARSPSGASNPVLAGGSAQPAELISRRAPVYPPAARTGRIHGVVVLGGVVGTDGRVKDLRIISGPEVLLQAALDAVSQWVYKPAMLNGKTIEAPVRVEIRFSEGM